MVPQAAVFGWSGYAGANQSEARGMVNWPTLDSSKELDSWSRSELCRKLAWLYANNGIFKGFIDTSADLMGWLTPQALTDDEEWNEEVEQRYRDWCGTENVFDVAGKFNFKTAQPMLARAALSMGDVFTVLTETATRRAQFAFYEGYQLANPKDASERWRDGVCEETPGGRHLAYGFRDGKTGNVKVIPAKDVIYTGEFGKPGHPRAVPRLAHAINDGLDITEINGFTKKAIKTAALFGIVRQVNNPNVPRSHMGIAGAPAQEVRTRAGNTAAGEPETVTERFETSGVFQDGQIPRLPTGEEAKILHDSRPHPNQQAFKADLIRQISVGYGLAPEVVWQMAGLTGPGVRFELDKAGRWVDMRRLALLFPWNRTVYLYWLAKEMKYGGLRMPQAKAGKPVRWWAHDYVAQRDLTIDRGKEGKQRMDAIDAGLGTWASWYQEMEGKDWQGPIRQRVKEVKFAKEECAAAGLEYEEVFKPRQGTAVAEKSGEQGGESEEEEPEKK